MGQITYDNLLLKFKDVYTPIMPASPAKRQRLQDGDE
jgi:hypothetical protein